MVILIPFEMVLQTSSHGSDTHRGHVSGEALSSQEDLPIEVISWEYVFLMKHPVLSIF